MFGSVHKQLGLMQRHVNHARICLATPLEEATDARAGQAHLTGEGGTRCQLHARPKDFVRVQRSAFPALEWLELDFAYVMRGSCVLGLHP
jgi:hypothetical protein